MKALFGYDFGAVRLHDGPEAAASVQRAGAQAATLGNAVAFAPDAYEPGSAAGSRLLAHELAHVVQQNGGTTGATAAPEALEAHADLAAAAVHRGQPVGRLSGAGSAAGPALQPTVIEVELLTYRTEYTPPGSRTTYRVGDAAATSVLMNIVESGSGDVEFQWFNFSRGEPMTGGWQTWDFRLGAAVIGMNSREFATVGRQLTAREWSSLWPDPRAELLRRHEAGQITLPDDAIVAIYTGTIHTTAKQVLEDNEQAVDALLNAPDRVQFFADYATGLREASLVRDAMVQRKEEIERRMVQMQGFSFGMAGRVINMDPYRRLEMARQLGAVEQALTFWNRAFPLLTRLNTADISASNVETTLRMIKVGIVETRARLALAPQGRAGFDLWELDQIRARVDAGLGPRARGTIASESTSRRRWGYVRAGLMVVGGIALLFVPGGAFIDLAIGVSMGAHAIEHARVLGQAARTGIHVDDALVSQAAANAAEVDAVLATVFAVLGAAGMGFRVLRVARMFGQVRRAAPVLEMSAQVRVARILANNPGWLRAGGNIADLQQAMMRAGSGLRFEELRVLRSLVYEAQGLRLPAASRESLDEMLVVVWNQRQQVLARAARHEAERARRIAAARQAGEPTPRNLPEAADAVYSIYSGAREANPLTRSSAVYLREAADIAVGRPAGAISNLQSGARGNLADLARTGQLVGPQVERTFLRFERAGADLRQVGERVYLNVKADEATGVMRTVVRDIVDNPSQFPGVSMAKLAGPASVSGRAESIVIYTENAAAATRVVERMRTYQLANPSRFQRTTPFMTERVMEGISLGSEPIGSGGAVSFGVARSRAIIRAVETSVARGESQEQFMQRVLDALRAAGVNPNAPHLNLPPAPVP